MREARTAKSVTGAPRSATPEGGRADGCGLRAVLWAGCPQADGGRMCDRVRGWQATAQRDSYLRDDDGGSARARRLAGSVWRDAGGHGKHRGVLEATVEPAGGTGHAGAGERSAYQASTRSQDGREGLRVVGRPVAARSAEGEFRTRPTPARVA